MLWSCCKGVTFSVLLAKFELLNAVSLLQRTRLKFKDCKNLSLCLRFPADICVLRINN